MACRRVWSAGCRAALLRSAGLHRAPRQHSCTSVTTERSQQLARRTNAVNVPRLRSYAARGPRRLCLHGTRRALTTQRLSGRRAAARHADILCIFPSNLSTKALLPIKESERPTGFVSTDRPEREEHSCRGCVWTYACAPQHPRFFIKPPLPSALLPPPPSQPPLLSPKRRTPLFIRANYLAV